MHRKSLSLLSGSILFFCSMLLLTRCNQPEEASSNQQSSIPASPEQSTPELADYMGQLQHYTHKFALSVAAENKEATEFYFHEVEALTDIIKEDVPQYEGYKISGLMDTSWNQKSGP